MRQFGVICSYAVQPFDFDVRAGAGTKSRTLFRPHGDGVHILQMTSGLPSGIGGPP
jgi:hypothetical protein